MEQTEEEYHTFVAPWRSSFFVPFSFVVPSDQSKLCVEEGGRSRTRSEESVVAAAVGARREKGWRRTSVDRISRSGSALLQRLSRTRGLKRKDTIINWRQLLRVLHCSS